MADGECRLLAWQDHA